MNHEQQLYYCLGDDAKEAESPLNVDDVMLLTVCLQHLALLMATLQRQIHNLGQHLHT